MGFLQDLGLDEIISSVREMTDEFTALKDDIITKVKDDVALSIPEPVSDLTETAKTIANDITNSSSK